MTSRKIVSGVLGDPAHVTQYRLEYLGDVIVERVIWGELPAPRTLFGRVVADSGTVWFRFWLAQHDQVVERYFRSNGEPLGTHIDVSGPLICGLEGCVADDYILDLEIDPNGRVTMHNEEEFERAVLLGELTGAQADKAETHLRELTTAIARNRFPPPLVRNWRIDPSRLQQLDETLALGTPGDGSEDSEERG